jgi:hypothetical protein
LIGVVTALLGGCHGAGEDRGVRTAVAADGPGETEFVRFLRARLAEEDLAVAGKRAFVDAVLSVPMWPSKEAADAAEQALLGLGAAYASHPDYRQEWRP